MSFRNDRLKRRLEGLSTPPMQIHRDRTPKIASGDRVRVHPTTEAITAGVAGLVGEVIEVCTPSDPGIVVIGAKGEDQVVNVSFKEKEGVFWFARNQLEFRGHAPGSDAGTAGAGQSPQQDVAGKADEPAPVAAKPKPWWRFGR